MRPTSTVHRLSLHELTGMITDGRLSTARPAGGPLWSLEQDALLFDSLESLWTIGQLIAWAPSRAFGSPWYLLDGHRRLHALRHTTHGAPPLVVRDLTETAPTYRVGGGPPDGGWHLPLPALMSTVGFLRATRPLPRHVRELGEDVGGRFLDARIDVVTLNGGSTEHVLEACERLVPGRVTVGTLARVPAPAPSASRKAPLW
jgi:hypothetical protein